MGVAVSRLVVDLNLIREHVHLQSVVPSDRNHMAAEIIDFGFNGPASLRTDESLVSADAACRLTTLSLALLRHFAPPGAFPIMSLGKIGAKLNAVQARKRRSSCHSFGTIRRPILSLLGRKVAEAFSKSLALKLRNPHVYERRSLWKA